MYSLLCSSNKHTLHARYELTLRNLCGQRRRDGDKVQVFGAVVDGHLPALAEVVGVGVTLSHEQIQRKTTIHQHSCRAAQELQHYYSQDKKTQGY